MPEIINAEDAQNFLESNPTATDIDLLSKHEIGVLASFLEVPVSSDINKPDLTQMVKSKLFGIHYTMGGENDGAVGGQPNDHVHQDNHEEHIPEGFTAEQYLELARINASQSDARLKLDHEYRMAQLNAQTTNSNAPVIAPPPGITMTSVIPPFTEDNVQDFFVLFEEVATGMGWTRDRWPFMLQTVLTGQARATYISVEVEVRQNYDCLKAAILKTYQLQPEAYRQTFRKTHKKFEETHTVFARTMIKTFNNWIKSKDVTDFKGLKELILLENFLWKIDSSVAYHLRGKKVDSLAEAADMADTYVLNNKFRGKKPSDNNSKFSNYKSDKSINAQKPVTSPHVSQTKNAPPARNVTPGTGNRGGAQTYNNHAQKGNVSPKVCTFCGKRGHLAYQCWAKEKADKTGQTVAAVSDSSNPNVSLMQDSRQKEYLATKVNPTGNGVVACVMQPTRVKPERLSPRVKDSYLPFISSGLVKLNGCVHEVKILRDTGSTSTLMVNPYAECPTGEPVIMRGAGGQFPAYLVNGEIECDLLKGEACIALCRSQDIPVPGVTLLLGNDVAGERVRPDPVLSLYPVNEPLTGELEKEMPMVFPVCAVTRSMAQVAVPSDINVPTVTVDERDNERAIDAPTVPDVVDLSNTFMAQLDAGDNNDTPPNCPSGLVELQQDDRECKELAISALSEEESEKEKGECFYIKKGVLWRRWRPPHRPIDDGAWDVHQVVVPKPCRKDILEMAHSIPLAGHLGVRKTLDRIRAHFHWPGMRADVVEFCRVCHTCQMTGKPNQKVPVHPLVPLPVFENPFTRVVVDIVGPLPKTSQGHIYLLTIMDMATRYPEAIPIRNTSAQTVVKELLKFFTRMGFPHEVQSDQGTNFTSNIFQQSLKELGIEHVKSSSYHPESQGVLERYHQTLKSMLRKYCEETGGDWDKGVPFILFATREVPTESLGFSPNELVFGHQVRGPLQLLQDSLVSQEGNQNLLKYVAEFKTRLRFSCEYAAHNLEVAKNTMKVWYDKRARVREFQPDDEVLVLLPLFGQPLSAKFRGPYKVVKRVGITDYVVATPDRRKPKQVFHINMLKPYHRAPDSSPPDSSSVAAIITCGDAGADDVCGSCPQISQQNVPDLDDIGDDFDVSCSLSNFQCNSVAWGELPTKLCHLSSKKANQLIHVLSQSPSVFRDTPGLTSLAVHDIDVGDATPIKLAPYRVSPQRRSILQVELDFMLSNNLITRALSQWSSPVTLVPKPDGSYRFCMDYRQVNAVTKNDTYPLPRIDDCIDQIGTASFISKIDLMKGYWQVPLTPRAREISCFVVNNQAFCCEVMPYGLKNAPATFQRLMNQVTEGVPGCVVYIDDILLFSHTWEEHLSQIRMLFSNLAKANLVVNLKKCTFIQSTVQYLGYTVGQGQVAPPQAKVESIVSFPTPNSKKQIQRYLGMIGYYRRFILNFSRLTAPLTDLLRKDVKFEWSSECEEAFSATKYILSSYPVLRAPDFTRSFSLAVDASNTGVGAVLLQEDDCNVLHPVCYFSKKLNSAQRNYSVIEKELLALILSLQYFSVYVQSAPGSITVYTDHHPLKFLHKFRNRNQRLTRWSLWLQEYSLEIKHIKGVQNVLADCLSRV